MTAILKPLAAPSATSASAGTSEIAVFVRCVPVNDTVIARRQQVRHAWWAEWRRLPRGAGNRSDGPIVMSGSRCGGEACQDQHDPADQRGFHHRPVSRGERPDGSHRGSGIEAPRKFGATASVRRKTRAKSEWGSAHPRATANRLSACLTPHTDWAISWYARAFLGIPDVDASATAPTLAGSAGRRRGVCGVPMSAQEPRSRAVCPSAR